MSSRFYRIENQLWLFTISKNERKTESLQQPKISSKGTLKSAECKLMYTQY